MSDPIERFWAKVDKRRPGECWPWLGTILNTGYGQFKAGDKRYMAHRYAYEVTLGPIPAGLQIDHVRARGCVMTQCVNPAHLEAVTPRENWLRSDAPTRMNLEKTTCPRGHAYDATRVGPRGTRYRSCKECERETLRRSRARRKAMA